MGESIGILRRALIERALPFAWIASTSGIAEPPYRTTPVRASHCRAHAVRAGAARFPSAVARARSGPRRFGSRPAHSHLCGARSAERLAMIPAVGFLARARQIQHRLDLGRQHAVPGGGAVPLDRGHRHAASALQGDAGHVHLPQEPGHPDGIRDRTRSSAPEHLRDFFISESRRWGRVVEAAKIPKQ